ncbi:hypothetical protein AX774_g7709 [Zancudomyces culisetae]|uniref:Uncharacterized protein n=1 Tax=Zancudomyces culisetae TaxID=1213189 RepID=A0A1R1PD98_ZANCU|nr:hypothetical protein AX774_g7709 [Zancudomyces culisetae]|eukprot:OMH78889.1 hypothetical protein AX774_g7709 [Zancudomyces culisetae]
MKEEEILELRDKKREWEQKYKAITQVQKIVEEIDAKTKLIEKVKYRDKQVQKKEYEGKKQEVMQRLERFKMNDRKRYKRKWRPRDKRWKKRVEWMSS